MPISKGLFLETVGLLQELIAIPSLSRQEDKTAHAIQRFFKQQGIKTNRKGNNVWAKNKYWSADKPTILLNSHHDTVKPTKGWTKDPFRPTLDGERLYGLGSNDAGASLVSLIATFLTLQVQRDLPYNLILAATAEEEISGKNGIASVVGDFGEIALGIIGEPTQMRMAIAEKGLMVVDVTVKGKAGHAARNEGVNAIYKALQDIRWIQQYNFEKTSEVLGSTKMTVTQVNAGTQHNVVPDACHFVIDVRTNEEYSNQAVFKILQDNLIGEPKARSFRLNSSKISLSHPIVQRGLSMNLPYYGSPTLSDQALLSGFPTLKMGCGKSARSHTADEFILLSEIEYGIDTYIELLSGLRL